MLYILSEHLHYPFQRLILNVPIEIELIIFAYSHNVKIGSNSVSWET